jgi:hypothetical protein
MGTLDGDKILSVLNQTLPKKLKSIMFPWNFSTINVNYFSNLVENWKGPKPFTMKFDDYQAQWTYWTWTNFSYCRSRIRKFSHD